MTTTRTTLEAASSFYQTSPGVRLFRNLRFRS